MTQYGGQVKAPIYGVSSSSPAAVSVCPAEWFPDEFLIVRLVECFHRDSDF
jgi:hypothetical protein